MCGAARYEARGEPLEIGHCHCPSCHQHTGAPIVTYVVFDADKVRFYGHERSIYKSSPGVRRAFCGQCGTALTWEGIFEENAIVEFHIGTLDEPENFVPDRHWHHVKRIGWFDVADDLPRYRGVGMKDEEPYHYGPAIEGLQAES